MKKILHAAFVHLEKTRAILGERHEGDVVVHDLDAFAGALDGGAITNVGTDLFDPVRQDRVVYVEDAHALARAHERFDEQRAEVARAARHEVDAAHSVTPRSSIQRMERRMPSSRAILGA